MWPFIFVYFHHLFCTLICITQIKNTSEIILSMLVNYPVEVICTVSYNFILYVIFCNMIITLNLKSLTTFFNDWEKFVAIIETVRNIIHWLCFYTFRDKVIMLFLWLLPYLSYTNVIMIIIIFNFFERESESNFISCLDPSMCLHCSKVNPVV